MLCEKLGKVGTNPKENGKELSISLGKLNYCLNALKRAINLIILPKIQINQNILTPKVKNQLTVTFMKRMMKEYDELKKDLD